MKKDYSLDDLIIDDIKPTKSKSKSILAIVALFIALLIIAIVMTRLLLSESDQNVTGIGEKYEELISPELKLDATDHDIVAEKKELDQLSSMMEEALISKADASTKELIDPILSRAEQIKPEIILIDETDTKIIEKPAQQEFAQNETAQKELTQKKQSQVRKSIEIPTPIVKKPVVQAKPRETQVKKAKPRYSYYIQVGSFNTQPSKQFLSVITNNGFQYKLKRGKLLIGPYSSDATARRDLARVKSKINKNAFIKHF